MCLLSVCTHCFGAHPMMFLFLSLSAAGMSRSVTITVAYLMTVSTLSFDEALKVVQFCREIANPNLGFRTQLQRYQEDRLLEVCRWFVELFTSLKDYFSLLHRREKEF